MQRADRAFELPRRRVRAGEREVPRDVVLEDRLRSLAERLFDPGESAEAIRVLEHRLGTDLEYSHLATHAAPPSTQKTCRGDQGSVRRTRGRNALQQQLSAGAAQRARRARIRADPGRGVRSRRRPRRAVGGRRAALIVQGRGRQALVLAAQRERLELGDVAVAAARELGLGRPAQVRLELHPFDGAFDLDLLDLLARRLAAIGRDADDGDARELDREDVLAAVVLNVEMASQRRCVALLHDVRLDVRFEARCVGLRDVEHEVRILDLRRWDLLRRLEATRVVLDDVLLDRERVDLRRALALLLEAVEVEQEITGRPRLLFVEALALQRAHVAAACGELEGLDRHRHAEVRRALVLTVELGDRDFFDQRAIERAASALLVIEIRRDDRAGLANAVTREETAHPVEERRRDRHAGLDLDVLELRLADLLPALEKAALLVRHRIGLDAAAFDRLQEPHDGVLAVELEREVRGGIGARWCVTGRGHVRRTPEELYTTMLRFEGPGPSSSGRAWPIRSSQV